MLKPLPIALKKDEARLNAGTASPKELEQTQHEIETLKKRQAALEEIELEIMVRNEAVQERLNDGVQALD